MLALILAVCVCYPKSRTLLKILFAKFYHGNIQCRWIPANWLSTRSKFHSIFITKEFHPISRSPFIRIRQHHVNENGFANWFTENSICPIWNFELKAEQVNLRFVMVDSCSKNKMSTKTASETHLKTNYMSNKQQWVWNVCS